EADTWWFELDPALTSGATSLMGFSMDHSQAVAGNTVFGRGFLIDGSKGDRLTLAQLVKRSSQNGVPYKAMSKLFTPDPFTQIDGQGTVLSGSFTDVSTDSKISIDLRVSQFENAAGWDGTHALLLNPAATPLDPNTGLIGTGFSVLGEPGGTEYGN